MGLSLDKIKRDIVNVAVAQKVTNVMSSISRTRVNKALPLLVASDGGYSLVYTILSSLISESFRYRRDSFLALNQKVLLASIKQQSYLSLLLARVIDGALSDRKITKSENLVMIFGSDRGLCGSLNSAIISAFSKNFASDFNDIKSIITVGSKQRISVSRLATAANVTSIDFESVNFENNYHKIQDRVINTLDSRVIQCSDLNLFYYKSISTSLCKPDMISLREVIDKMCLPKSDASYYDLIDFKSIETVDAMLDIYDFFLRSMIGNLVINNYISENVLRMISMNSAHNNAKEIYREKQILYAKTRQEKITNELLEMTKN